MLQAHKIPFDLMVLFAEAGGDALAVTLATTCRALKQKLDQRYVVKYTGIGLRQTKKHKRRKGLVGKFHTLWIYSKAEMKYLPPGVTDLHLNFPIESVFTVPSTVKALSFHKKVSIEHIKFPPALESLHIRCEPVKLSALPCTLTNLHLTKKITIDEPQWPPKLRKLELTWVGGRIDHFPPLLEHLTLKNYTHRIKKFPEGLISLQLPRLLGPLPSGLKSLTLRCDDELKGIPDGLEVLVLQGWFNQPLPALALKHLSLSSAFNQPIVVPSGLKVLHFGQDFDQPLDHLPPTLKELTFDWKSDFNKTLHCLPDSLEILSMGKRFNRPLHRLPTSLKILRFGSGFNQRLPGLPPHLIELYLGYYYDKSLDDLLIPETLRKIQFFDGVRFSDSDRLDRAISRDLNGHRKTMLRNGFSWQRHSSIIYCDRVIHKDDG